MLAKELDLLIIEGYKKEHFPKVLFSDELKAVSLKGVIATVGKKKPPSPRSGIFNHQKYPISPSGWSGTSSSPAEKAAKWS